MGVSKHRVVGRKRERGKQNKEEEKKREDLRCLGLHISD
jgi:hypothetical protein